MEDAIKKANTVKRLITEIVSLRKEIVRVQDEIDNKHVVLAEVRRILQGVCLHEKVEEKEEYFSGGYLYRSRYVTTRTCTICDLELSQETQEGSYE